MNSQENKYYSLILIGGIIDLVLLFFSIGMWLWSILGYSIFSAEERKTSAALSSAAGTLFWVFIIYTLIFGIIVNILIPVNNKKRGDSSYLIRNNNGERHVFCEECGCPNVTIHNDGTCECNGCGFTWSE